MADQYAQEQVITATTGTLARSARTPPPARLNHLIPSVPIPEPALPPIRYVCLECSDPDTQVLGWGRTCWLCTSPRIAPSATIANTRPGVAATELLEHWRHLIP